MVTCKSGGNNDTEILLSLSSAVPVVEVELRARNITRDEETVRQSLDGRDITVEPLVLLIRPSAIADTGQNPTDGFLFYAKGLDARGDVVVAASTILRFEPETRVEVSIVMEEGFTDADDDGFQSCINDPLCDCNDVDPSVNPFTEESCDDSVDNNCTGLPVNEGCPCRIDDPPKPCTGLPDQFLALAGVGACELGFLQCLDDGDGDEFGVLETECTSGTFSEVEIPDDYIDNNCDGRVDEGSTCTSGATRACFLGWVDDPAAPANLQTAATDRALGECRTGIQVCNGGTWGDCTGETRPQLDPVQGFGFIELPPDATSAGQCDGLDNDCDGVADEEPFFDGDRDGFTFCGTCRPEGTGLCDDSIDCNDSDSAISPAAVEICGNTLDEDCRCDHDPNNLPFTDPASVIGLPYNRIGGGTNCSTDRRFLNCARNETRSDLTPLGVCDDTQQSTMPYFFGYVPDQIGGDCVLCASEYGRSCNGATGACSTKPADCSTCDTEGAVAEARPDCTLPDPLACMGTTPANWVNELNTDDNNFCPGFTDCDQNVSGSGPYYWGISSNNVFSQPLCYIMGTTTPGVCDGNRNCRPRVEECDCIFRDTESGFECAIADRGVEDPGRPICQRPNPAAPNACRGTVGPDYINVLQFEDPYDDCPGAATCNGMGACNTQQGGDCSLTTECEQSLTCVDGKCCENACSGTCQACSEALNGMTGGDGLCLPVAAQQADNDPSVTCGGTTGCTGGSCACEPGTGLCKRQNGAPCGIDTDCASANCECQDDNCTTQVCSAVDCDCQFADSGGTTCVGPLLDGVDDQEDSCGPTLTCNGAGACNLNNGDSCGDDFLCETNECECTNATCTTRACAASSCVCRFGPAGSCVTPLNESVNDPGDCDVVGFTCSGGQCRVTTGGNCTFNSDCTVGDVCILGNCSAPSGTTGPCDEGADCQANHTCVNPGASGQCLLNDAQTCPGPDSDCVNQCIQGTCGPRSGTGGACDNTPDCQGGHTCQGNTCLLNDGQACGNNVDCLNTCIGPLCGLPQGPGGTCDLNDDADCASGSSCVGTTCLGETGTACGSNAVCIDTCIGSLCSPPSATGSGCDTGDDQDCAASNLCDTDQVCRRVNGQGCGNNNQCLGSCITASCADLSNTGGTCDAGDSADCVLSPTHMCKAPENECRRVNGETCSANNQCLNTCIVLSLQCANFSNIGGACDATDDCLPGLECSPANQCRVPDGEACTVNGDCLSTACREDWDGVGNFCSTAANNCVDDAAGSGTSVPSVAQGIEQCRGDGFRTCLAGGVWAASVTQCNGFTCDPGSEAANCGFISDAQNVCTSGSGCVPSVACQDCGDVTASVSGSDASCDSGDVSACSAACGSVCEQNDTQNTGMFSCISDDSRERVDICGVSGTTCAYEDNGAVSDIDTPCPPYTCNSGNGLCYAAPCGLDTECSSGNFCDDDDSTCKAEFANGALCDRPEECASGFCECSNATCTARRCASADCAQCTQVNGSGTCTGTSVNDGVDDVAETCGGGLTCNGSGDCHLADGSVCTAPSQCESNFCECADTDCDPQRCSSADCDRCTTVNAAGNVCEFANLDPFQDDFAEPCSGVAACSGFACACDGNGNDDASCLRLNGETCTATSQCISGFCECADATCSARVCAAADCNQCTFANGTTGACGAGNINANVQDAAENCAVNELCDGAGNCDLVAGQTCTADAQCISQACECQDAGCTGRICAVAECQQCTFATPGTGACNAAANFITADVDDTADPCATNNRCNGAGACALRAGQNCTVDANCIFSCECRNAACTGSLICADAECAQCTHANATTGACGTGGNINANVDDAADPCGTNLVCNGSAACADAPGQTCDTAGADTDCSSGFCECGASDCSALVCAVADCTQCTFANSTTGACGAGNIAMGTDDLAEPCTMGPMNCNGSGICTP